MRLWTVHPRYLDPPGLVALWREGLLALKVLRGKTKGYRNHPQLYRFRNTDEPVSYLGAYLTEVFNEAVNRGYSFDNTKIPKSVHSGTGIVETSGQIEYEWQHLLKKLQNRNVSLFRRYKDIQQPEPHPLFRIVRGGVRRWERISS